MAAYATIADLCARFDVRTIGEFVSDDGVELLRTEVLAHPTVEMALEDACGDVDANLRAGGRYTPEQLTSLDDRSRSHLKRVVCTIAMSYLMDRRPALYEEQAEALRTRAREHLKQLAQGTNVFGLADDTDPHVAASIPQLSGPTSVEISDRNFLAARMADRHVPSIQESNPRYKG